MYWICVYNINMYLCVYYFYTFDNFTLGYHRNSKYIILNFPALNFLVRSRHKRAGISKTFLSFYTLFLYIPGLTLLYFNLVCPLWRNKCGTPCVPCSKNIIMTRSKFESAKQEPTKAQTTRTTTLLSLNKVRSCCLCLSPWWSGFFL